MRRTPPRITTPSGPIRRTPISGRRSHLVTRAANHPSKPPLIRNSAASHFHGLAIVPSCVSSSLNFSRNRRYSSFNLFIVQWTSHIVVVLLEGDPTKSRLRAQSMRKAACLISHSGGTACSSPVEFFRESRFFLALVCVLADTVALSCV